MWALARYRGSEVIFVCAVAVEVEWDDVLYLLDRLEGAASSADDAPVRPVPARPAPAWPARRRRR